MTGLANGLRVEKDSPRVLAIGAEINRRAFRVRLTRAGGKAFADMAREHEAWVAGLFSGLALKDQHELFRLLARFKQHAMKDAKP